MEFKREAIEYAEKNSNHKAAEKFRFVLENGGKTNWKYLSQQLNQRIKGWKVMRENH